MDVAEPLTRRRSRTAQPRTRGRALGLDVDSAYELPALGRATGARSDRSVGCRESQASELDRRFHGAGATSLVELRHPDGRLFLSVRHDEARGYRIYAPRHGRHVVSPDGTLIDSTRPRTAADGWERLFFAQTLPLAAALQGLEVLHASAVAIDGRAIAFTAPSGAGKSSLAAHLVAAGATFLTDDVLAIEALDGRVLAHPGPARAFIAARELGTVDPTRRTRLGPRVGSTDKLHLSPTAAPEPVPLAFVYRIRRSSGAGATRIEEHLPVAPRLVLGASFLAYLRTPQRLLNQLSTCAALAASVRVFDLEIPASVSARLAAADVLTHVAAAA